MIEISRWSKHPYYFIDSSLDQAIIKAIQGELTYYIDGFERSNKFKTGQWDGTTSLLYRTKKGVYFFPVGMLKRVTKIIDEFGEEFYVRNSLTLDNVRMNYQTLGLEWTGPKLRDYQEDTKLKLLSAGGGIMALPTGAGKTLVMLKIAQEIDLPFVVVVHTKELMYQWENVIKDNLDGFCPHVVGDGYKDFGSKATVVMMQSLSKMLASKKPPNLDFPVYFHDEVHRVPADTAYTIAMHLNSPFRCGASATPRRTDGADLKIFAAMGEIESIISPETLIKRGIIAKPKFVFLDPPGIKVSRKSKYQQAYVDYIVTNADRNKSIIDAAEKFHSEGYKVYIHVERIDHGEILAERIKNATFLCGSDKTSRRKAILDHYKENKDVILISTLLKEGVDIPSMSCFIAAGAGKSPIAVLQKAGRALRVEKGKKDAIIVDIKDRGRFFGDHWEERYGIYKVTFGSYCPDL